jgi:hypothetical protein
MAEFPSPSPASIDRDFQHLQLTDSEVLDADPVKEVQADSTEGNRRRTLWDDVENWLRRGVMQQRAKEIREQHRCIGQGILIPRTCTGKQSQSPCHSASCQTCVDLNYALYLTQGLSQAPDSVETNCSRRIATNLSIIQSSSRNGCQKCAIIYNGIKKLFMTAAPLENGISTETHPEVEIGLWYRRSVEVKFLGFHLEFYSEHGAY